ncbi:MAG TPA: response regulator transcription factor [Chloroflexota bacterium]|jgi:two-component system KDP operon response regulator KdpE
MKLLVVDHDAELIESMSVAVGFHWPGAQVLIDQDGQRALSLIHQHEPDVVLLEAALPDRSGFELLREIRRLSNVPVILVTERCGDVDQIQGLALGADDYVAKPFNQLVLLARIQAAVRRAGLPAAYRAPDFRSRDLAIDFEHHDVRIDGRSVHLTPVEYKLLSLLVRNAGRPVSHQTLTSRIWGPDWGATSNNLKALVSRLRSKIEINPDRPRYIVNQRGVGYQFVVESPARRATA